MKKHSAVVLADRFWQEAIAAGVGGALAALVFGQTWIALGALVITAGIAGLAARRAQAAAATAQVTLAELREDVDRHRKRAAYEDIETGLGTAKQLDIGFTRQLARQQRWSEPFSIVVLEVNDAYRPERRLSTVTAASIAKGLLEVARVEDTVCRLDNWTFVVLLSAAERDGADAFVARARTVVSAVQHPGETGDVFVTMRAGVSTWSAEKSVVVDMLAEADRDMKAFERGLQVERQWFQGNDDLRPHRGENLR